VKRRVGGGRLDGRDSKARPATDCGKNERPTRQKTDSVNGESADAPAAFDSSLYFALQSIRRTRGPAYNAGICDRAGLRFWRRGLAWGLNRAGAPGPITMALLQNVEAVWHDGRAALLPSLAAGAGPYPGQQYHGESSLPPHGASAPFGGHVVHCLVHAVDQTSRWQGPSPPHWS